MFFPAATQVTGASDSWRTHRERENCPGARHYCGKTNTMFVPGIINSLRLYLLWFSSTTVGHSDKFQTNMTPTAEKVTMVTP